MIVREHKLFEDFFDDVSSEEIASEEVETTDVYEHNLTVSFSDWEPYTEPCSDSFYRAVFRTFFNMLNLFSFVSQCKVYFKISYDDVDAKTDDVQIIPVEEIFTEDEIDKAILFMNNLYDNLKDKSILTQLYAYGIEDENVDRINYSFCIDFNMKKDVSFNKVIRDIMKIVKMCQSFKEYNTEKCIGKNNFIIIIDEKYYDFMLGKNKRRFISPNILSTEIYRIRKWFENCIGVKSNNGGDTFDKLGLTKDSYFNCISRNISYHHYEKLLTKMYFDKEFDNFTIDDVNFESQDSNIIFIYLVAKKAKKTVKFSDVKNFIEEQFINKLNDSDYKLFKEKSEKHICSDKLTIYIRFMNLNGIHSVEWDEPKTEYDHVILKFLDKQNRDIV